MGVFKEEVNMIQNLESREHGVKGNKLIVATPEIKNMLREPIKEFLELPGSAIIENTNKKNVKTRIYRLIVMWGSADYGLYDATQMIIYYLKEKNNEEHFVIRSGHVFTDENGIVQN